MVNRFIGRHKTVPIKIIFLVLSLAIFYLPLKGHCQTRASPVINIVFTSDAHYGITRAKFRGDTNVAAYKVNAAMISQVNTLPGLTLPAGEGINSGKKAGPVDYVIEG